MQLPELKRSAVFVLMALATLVSFSASVWGGETAGSENTGQVKPAATTQEKWSEAGAKVKEAAAAVGEVSADTAEKSWDATKKKSAEVWDKTSEESVEALEKTRQETKEALEKAKAKIHSVTAPAGQGEQ